MEEIDLLTKDMETEIKAIKQELFKFCWYMRGGLSVEEAYLLDQEDREILANLIDSNLETTKSSGLPFF